MEAFEAFVALALEDEGLVVSESVKFPVRLRTRRQDQDEIQTHGYEVDLVGACADRLVLASVKPCLGSRGGRCSRTFHAGWPTTLEAEMESARE